MLQIHHGNTETTMREAPIINALQNLPAWIIGLAPSWVNCTTSIKLLLGGVGAQQRKERKLIFVLNKDGIPFDFIAIYFEIDLVSFG